MYEARHERPVPVSRFIIRLFTNLTLGLLVTIVSLGVGMLGYHHYEGLSWIDSYVNAAMILSGMGPLTIQTDAGKLFAGSYALFSGIIFLVVMGIIFAPIFHRFFHTFHFTNKTGQ